MTYRYAVQSACQQPDAKMTFYSVTIENETERTLGEPKWLCKKAYNGIKLKENKEVFFPS